jgi:hypothetical protein
MKEPPLLESIISSLKMICDWFYSYPSSPNMDWSSSFKLTSSDTMLELFKLTVVIILDNSLFCEVLTSDWGFLLNYYFVFLSKLLDLLKDSLGFFEGYISEKLIPIVFYRFGWNANNSVVTSNTARSISASPSARFKSTWILSDIRNEKSS